MTLQNYTKVTKFNHIPIKTPVMETAHEDNKHFYSINGEKYPSITTILHSFPNPGIEIWKSKTPNWKEIQEESFKVGTSLHSLIENYLKNENFEESTKELDSPENYAIYPLSLFFNLQSELNKINNIRCQETHLYHGDLKIAGMVDCIAEYDGVLSVIDFKQSRKRKIEKYVKSSGYYTQVCGYANMFEYCCKQKIDQGVILIANWDGTTSTHKIKIDDYQSELESKIEQYYNTKKSV